MISYGKETKLKPDKVIDKAVQFFGPNGLGLQVEDQGSDQHVHLGKEEPALMLSKILNGAPDFLCALLPKPFETSDHFATSNSWGYRLVGRLDYLNAIGAWNVVPRFAWRHDVSGITPGPGGNFIEGNKAFTLGVNFNHQSTWFMDLSYTNFFGAGRYNLINDRDFVAANIKFLF